MRYLTHTIISLLFFLPALLSAQQSQTEDFQDGIILRQINPVSGPTIMSPSENALQNPAMGFGYQAVIEHLRSRVASIENENYLHLSQQGNENVASVVQEGNKNAIQVDQTGDNNFYQTIIKGEENLIHALQMGYNNKLFQELTGDRMELQVIQQGSGNELIQIEASGNAPAYQIHQRGDGMQLKIEHNSGGFGFPLK